MRHLLISCALCALALPATAEDNFFRCIDSQGVVMLTDRPCETLPNASRPVLEKEHFVLPPSERSMCRHCAWRGKHSNCAIKSPAQNKAGLSAGRPLLPAVATACSLPLRHARLAAAAR
jgi:hypothetical protein